MLSQLFVVSLHESVVQATPSLQSASSMHTNASQVSVSSLQTVPVRQGLPVLEQELLSSSQYSVPSQKFAFSGQLTGISA
jgi:hypothetical protein